MAEQTGISWTKSTFNAWIGCTKVGPGCDLCYAEALDERHKWGGATHWGRGVARMRTSASYWNQPLKWNLQAMRSKQFWPVFCCSLADVFDNEVPNSWRSDLFALIDNTPYLTWQLVTKRVSNVAKMCPVWMQNGFPKNVWIIATTVNQDEFDRDWPRLKEIPVRVRGLSIEPMLGNIRFSEDVRDALHWAIYGGESTQKRNDARECRTIWIKDGILQCRHFGIAPFVKQGGSNLTEPVPQVYGGGGVAMIQTPWSLGKNADPTRWPAWMRVQEFPHHLHLLPAPQHAS